MEQSDIQGLVFNIQHFSMHDGPGIRTLVFFKGCPLRCRWCSNPESQSRVKELGYDREKCLRCGTCLSVCTRGALTLSEHGLSIDRSRCHIDRALCVQRCPAEALRVYGKTMTVGEVLDEAEKEAPFYRSHGGITLSGGEPLMQGEFALALLRGAGRRRLRTAMETCALADRELFLEAASLLDYLMVDIKLMDNDRHREATGRPVQDILDNLRAVRRAYPSLPLHVRTPVVPGFNDNMEDILAIASFAAGIGAARYELLPYHRLGLQKYGYLERTYPLSEDLVLDNGLFQRLRAAAAEICPVHVVVSDGTR